jgi:hypothetical protein
MGAGAGEAAHERKRASSLLRQPDPPAASLLIPTAKSDAGLSMSLARPWPLRRGAVPKVCIIIRFPRGPSEEITRCLLFG